MSTVDDKLDKILDNQVEMGKSIVVIETKLASKEKRLDKVETNVDGLNRFKWGVVGTAVVSVSTFLKSLF